MKLFQQSKKSGHIINLHCRKEEFNLEIKNSFEVVQLLLEEEQSDVKLTDTTQEIEKEIDCEAYTKKAKKTIEKTR